MTTIQWLDPIYVDIQQSSTDLRLREQMLSGSVEDNTAPVQLQLGIGTKCRPDPA